MLLKVLVSEDDFDGFGALAADYKLTGSGIGDALSLDVEVMDGGVGVDG